MEKQRQGETTMLFPPQKEEHSVNWVPNKQLENAGKIEETAHMSKSDTGSWITCPAAGGERKPKEEDMQMQRDRKEKVAF